MPSRFNMQQIHAIHLELEMLQNFFSQAPVGIAISRGADFTYEMANDYYLKLVNKPYEAIVGKTLDEAFPELNNDFVKELLNSVIKSGQPFYGNEFPFNMKRFGKEEIAYFNFVYQPLRDGGDDTVNGIMVVAYEVTELVTARKKIEDAEERLRLAVDAGELAIYDLNLVTGDVVSSPRFYEICGLDPSETITHTTFLNMIKPGDLPIRNKALEEALKTGLLMYEVRIIWKNGSIHWIRVRGKVHYNDNRKPVRIVGTVADITLQKIRREELEKKVEERANELKRKNEELQQQKEFVETILDSSVSAMAVYDKDMRLLSINRSICELLGLNKKDILNKRFDHVFPAAVNTQAEYDLRRALQGETVHNKMYLSPVSNRYFENFVVPLKDNDNSVYAALVIGRDITENIKASEKLQEFNEELLRVNDQLEKEIEQRKLAEEELKIKNQQLLEAQALAKMGSWEWDVLSNTITWSKGMFYVYEIDPSEQLTYEKYLSLLHPEDREVVANNITTAFQTKQFKSFFHRIITPGGNVKTLHGRGDVVLNEAGEVIKMIGTGQDVTEEKKNEENLMAKTAELEYVNTELEKFAYIASHDLQEPLRKIQTFSDLVRSGKCDDATSQKYLDKINGAAKRMSALIKDVLNYSRLSKADELFSRTDLNNIIEMVKSDFELLIAEKKAEIRSDSLPVIKGIPAQLSQLFSNLISNSLKFCDKSPVITICCNYLLQNKIKEKFIKAPASRYVEIIFRDNGIGFEQEYAEQIFNIFQRLNTHSSYTGTGIGLAICKKIAENHKGFIIAESESGRGAIFKVYLPLE